MRKGRIKSPWVSLKCLIRIQFLWRKDHIYTRHFSKHTNKLSQLQNKKIWIYLQLLSSQFTSSTEVKLLTWIHRRLEWIILSVRSLTFFEEIIVVTVLAKLVRLFFQKCTCAFFSYALSYWQMSDCNRLEKIMFQSLFGSLLNHLYHYVNENVLVKHLSLIYITSILTTLYSLKNCSVYRRSCGIYSPISFGFFRKEFR